MTYIKPFDQELHKQFNEPARECARKLLKQKFNWDVLSNPNPKQLDLILERDNQFCGYCEVTVKSKWICGSFPYPAVKIIERKYNQLKEWTQAPVYLLIVSGSYDRGIIIGFPNLDQNKTEFSEYKNYMVQDGQELACDVPADKFTFIELED